MNINHHISYFRMKGGLDKSSAAIAIDNGKLLDVKNYEVTPSGYKRIAGYERFNGMPAPSSASYWKLRFDAGTASVSEGNTLTGAISAATGIALLDAVVESGSYAGSDASGYIVLYNVSGTFQDDENLQVSASTKCVADGTAVIRGDTNDADDATWLQDAIEKARTAISAPTGTNGILGVWQLNDTVYTIRNATMYRSSSTGWVACDLGRTVDFTSGGTYVIAEGDTITGATSAATAVVKRIIITSGTFASGDAAGRLILLMQTGTFQPENLNVGANLNVATIASDSSAHALPSTGRYEFVNYNFGGHTSTIRMYGCNGAGRAFEWDGTTFVPIITGMTIDTPAHIAAHKNHLFLSFEGGSIQHSAIVDPYSWSALLGAAEIMQGDEVTGMANAPGDILVIFTRNSTNLLYGTSSADWTIKTLSRNSGAIEYTIQEYRVPIFIDSRGIVKLDTTQEFGDFKGATISENIQSVLDAKRNLITASVFIKAKDQYRLFFSDNTFIILSFFRGELLGYSLGDFGMQVTRAYSCEDANGNEKLYITGIDGMVYQMDIGTSFDGAAVESFLRLPFNYAKTPRQKKRWRKVIVDIDAAQGTLPALYFVPDFSGSDPDISASLEYYAEVYGGGGYYDIDNWNEFVWSAKTIGQAEADITGVGINIGLVIFSETTYTEPYTIQAVHLEYSMRGRKK